MEFSKDQAIYLQIADLICENILAGEWAEDSRIPSVREMAVSLEVNPNTVMRTYNHLQDLEIIQNQRGVGYFISKNAQTITRKYKKNEFVNVQLPQIFKMMKLLDIDMSELKTLYDNQ
jgi:GntR family transcriptional regulator